MAFNCKSSLFTAIVINESPLRPEDLIVLQFIFRWTLGPGTPSYSGGPCKPIGPNSPGEPSSTSCPGGPGYLVDLENLFTQVQEVQ